MSTVLKEPIKVIAVFDNGVKPVKFKWKGRVYPVKEITYAWTSKEGDSRIMHFSVSDGAALYEITYDSSALKWSLEGVQA
ncbi:MAG: hypothetical protein HY893_04955 [Deltaproteobacteria bacterium]|nr:hypothetical protein [Deltaproteobacteria bacterium]